MRIWKYPLNEGTPTTLTTPAEWNPISVGYQGARLVLWAEAGAGTAETRIVFAFPTGTSTDYFGEYKLRYVGTAQAPDGSVFHVYWEPPPINIVEREI